MVLGACLEWPRLLERAVATEKGLPNCDDLAIIIESVGLWTSWTHKGQENVDFRRTRGVCQLFHVVFVPAAVLGSAASDPNWVSWCGQQLSA